MMPAEALAYIQDHGVVLASAKGPVPRLAEVTISDSDEILVCRLIEGKLSFAHRRLSHIA